MEIFDIRPSEKQKGLIFFQKNLQLQKKISNKKSLRVLLQESKRQKGEI